ncbi:exo-beta-D-glucosaminidase [Abditibacteriota bacterium]|nr:exo-beta-D-glucosaminidase [Abditibacteriota bacterium]
MRFRTALLTLLVVPIFAATFRSASAAPALPPISPISGSWQLQDAARVTATGEVLSRVGSTSIGGTAWYKAAVPGTVLTTLVNNGVYPEPLYGENNRPDKIPESLSRTSYWYRTNFRVPNSYKGKRTWLNFNGINYMAEVWVNGHNLGMVKGAFTRGLFDVTPYITMGAANALAVHILPPPHPGVPHEQTAANGVGPNGGITALDGPTFLCSIGWDWIPGIRDRNMGIWQNVFLSATGPVTLKDTYVTSDLPLPRIDSADLTVQTMLRNVTDQPQTGQLVGTFDETTFRVPVTVAANGTQSVTLTPAQIPALHINNPRLWWPNGYGPQNLHSLRLRFLQNEAESDATTTSFGIRKITYALPGSDNLALSVNGVPVLCKGGNWGMDEAMKRISAARLDAQVRMHKQANYTMIRNWVGQSTSEDFYNACDKYGIMLWDEFFQPNPSDGPNPEDTELYLANVREKILRFRSHPSIAVWCARNEGFPPPIIDAGIQKLMSELERERLYQPSSTSGRGVNSGGPYRWREPRQFYSYGEPFKTEVGSVSIPTLESIQSMMPSKDWNTINDDWAEHDMAGGAQGGDSYPNTLASRYGAIGNLADFARKGQLANYETFRAMFEGRNAKLFKPVTGVITWMSNPSQPSFVWQIYSWDLEPNSSLFASRKACEPIHIQMNQTDWHLMVINNTPRTLTGLIAKVAIYNLDGALKSTRTIAVTANPSAANDAGETVFPDDLSPVHFVKLELRAAGNQLLSDNFYWRETQQDKFAALTTMPLVALTATVKRHDAGDRALLDVTLQNTSTTPALMTHLQLRNSRTGARVLPVFYSDNYVSLLSGESKTITVEAAKADLGGAAPLLLVDGWNVTVKPASGIAPNKPAQDTGKPAVSVINANRPLRINAGGGAGPGSFFTFGSPAISTSGFIGDTYVADGSTKTVPDAIDTNALNSAPAFVYQSERWGESTYTIPAPTGRSYIVRLHFAETTFDAAGARKFNVSINGNRVLSDFDVFAEAGGKNKAVVRDFPSINPDAEGHIVIAFGKGTADLPKISGLEIIPTP